MEQNVRTRTRITHEKFRKNKIQNGRLAVIFNSFYPSTRWARRGIVVPFVRRRRRAHSFGYYTNMVQQIKFIIHTNIQPLPALFFTQGQGHRSKI